ncbi:GNAT family N-acetyltransferase [Sutcliffiella horikoshii]|uniref:GNAT family N-acetyltransferase n=1 Tax=Sutcliffiella horikoshii TaxID=79883 RepID=UPI00203F83A6|nr:GNAT family protein [Sutcliffiella horikoshii]MCM3620288.1 GNAT family N-acetyltransferase [Sutcliffiella horikoshii]
MNIHLETERLLLRRLELGDSDRVEELASDYELAKTTLTVPHPYPAGSAKDFIRSVWAAEDKGLVVFAVIEKESERLIGIINIKVTLAYKRGELGYWVGRPYWGKGYGTEAARAVVEYGFNELGLNKVFAGAFADNPGSWRIMEKVGMKHEGTWRQHAKRDGRFVDLAYYGVLREEFEGKG